MENTMKINQLDEGWIHGSKRLRIYLDLIKSHSTNLSNINLLDLGCGNGDIALTVSSYCSNIVALDIDDKKLMMCIKRKKKMELDNFHALCASGDLLPFKKNCIHLVISIGSFEYFPLSNPELDPTKTHISTLKDVTRITKQEGLFFLGIENRYWLGFWFGMKDQHSFIRFITILPRFIANIIYNRFKQKKYYLERTYSYYELTALLSMSGMTIINKYTGLPSWGYFENIADLDNGIDVRDKISSIKAWRPFVHGLDYHGSKFMYGLYNLAWLPKIFWLFLNSINLFKFFCSNYIYVCRARIEKYDDSKHSDADSVRF